MYAPYDTGTYQAALKFIKPDDYVLDIGAGDLRLARQMAKIARKVYAVEIKPELISQAADQHPIPGNLIPVCADARSWEFPTEITVGVLLMRHCAHFQQYAKKLATNGAQRLITNARWRMGVELITLNAPRLGFEKLEIGWYACECGSAGFKSGSPELLTPATEAVIHEVTNCPNCRG
ncbi:MAG TPA: methyltransferase domain-containing protein [Anaerolineales bacterium]